MRRAGPVIRFGVGHISFSQSLLVRAASAIERHDGPAGDGHRREQRTGCLQLFRHACRQRAGATMNTAIICLTANGTIGFAEWFDSGGTIFAARAEREA